MTLQTELKALYPVVKAARLEMEERGGDPDMLYTLLFAILKELRAIKEKP
jgi:hypothetical protein